jgi:hypothetical protein
MYIWSPGPGVKYAFFTKKDHKYPYYANNSPKCFLLLFCVLKRFKLGSYLHNTNIWGHFWSTYGCLTPLWQYIGYPPTTVSWLFCIIRGKEICITLVFWLILVQTVCAPSGWPHQALRPEVMIFYKKNSRHILRKSSVWVDFSGLNRSKCYKK